MTVYQFICEKGDRRSKLWKELSKQYDSLCIKKDGKYMETPEAKKFANQQIDQLTKQL